MIVDNKEKAKNQDREYADKKASKSYKIDDGLDHEITQEQKRVNLRWLRRMRSSGV